MRNELAAFRAVDFNWVRPLQSIWHDPVSHIAALHRDIAEDVLLDFARLKQHPAPFVQGRVIQGAGGTGKTHLLGDLRRRVWEAGGWFVLLDIVGISDFWRTTALGFINSLQQRMPDGEAQHTRVFLRVLQGLPKGTVMSVAREIGEVQRGNATRMAGQLIGLLQAAYPAEASRHRDIVRAFILLRDAETFNAAYSWLQGLELEADDLRALGFAGQPPQPAEMVRGMAWFMSLAGPIMIGVDQLDAIVAAANVVAGASPDTVDEDVQKARGIIHMLAGGLMDIANVVPRSLTTMMCLPDTWNAIESRALGTVTDRFLPPDMLRVRDDAAIVEQLVRDRTEPAYADAGFAPPYPTWPFTPEAIRSGAELTMRGVLMRCDAHRRHCLRAGEITECSTLLDVATATAAPKPAGGLDSRFQQLCQAADPRSILDADPESKALRTLFAEILDLYVRQTPVPDDVAVAIHRDPEEKVPTLHGRVVFTFHAEHEREQHYCFRALTHTNAIAFQSRLRAAVTAAGIEANLAFRHLFIIRADVPPSGRRTAELVQRFKAAGGHFLAPVEPDVRLFLALRALRDEKPEGFDAWLAARQPLCDSAIFKGAGLCPSPIGARPPQPPQTAESVPLKQDKTAPLGVGGQKLPSSTADAVAQSRSSPSEDAAIPIGRRLDGGADKVELLKCSLLPRHTAIIAGSGSGKTVLLRRIVEEAALAGIPSIVLDTNNDLARLGDAWPEPPPTFSEEDAGKARRYAETVEVVIWTPGMTAGNSVGLSLLPDFAALDDDEDEREQAVQMALATLVPFVGATGAKGPLKEGVLADALRLFARRRNRHLQELVDLLSELPEGATEIGDAQSLADQMADRLRAATAVNPLLRPQAQTLDPAILFVGRNSRTRVSIVNFSGLQSDSARQSFVNQLQMALFTWIRRNPSPHGRLYVMDEAQNFAPSAKSTPAKESARALAAQARKYGLGMIFATQAPKGIDNTIVSNCTTHFYGRQNSPATIAAAQGLMSAKGGGGADIARLSRGQFYFSTEGTIRPIRLETPLCLTHHPHNPLSPDEVEERARLSRTVA